MPLIPTSEDDMDLWMSTPADEALRLQYPCDTGVLRIVARGEREDTGGQLAA